MGNKIFVKLSIIALLLFSNQEIQSQGLKGLWNKVKNEVEKEAKKITREAKNKTIEQDNPKNSNEEVESNSSTTLNFENQLKFESPNDNNYISIEIQSHKGLARFGTLNSYGLNNKREFNKLPSNTRTQIFEKRKLEKSQYNAYYSLVDLKFMKTLYDGMNKTILTTPSSTDSKKANSYKAQNHLKSLALMLSTTQNKNKFFCNPEIGDCVATEHIVKRDGGGFSKIKSGIGNYWGGPNASSFSKQRNFSQFVKEQLPTLQNWSERLWKDNSLTAYLVVPISYGTASGNYDFDNQGYWIRLDLGLTSYGGLSNGTFGKENYYTNYKPIHDFEKIRLDAHKQAMSNREYKSLQLLYKITPEKAEKLMKDNNGLLKGFAVYKTKISFESVNDKRYHPSDPNKRTNYVNYAFNIENPIVELYKDEALLEKFGEISIVK